MIDQVSSTWTEIEAHLRARIAQLEKELRKHGSSITDTEYARGRLAEAEELLSLPTKGQSQPPLSDPEPYEDA